MSSTGTMQAKTGIRRRQKTSLDPAEHFHTGWKQRTGAGGFDYTGTFEDAVACKSLKSSLADGRKVEASFSGAGTETTVVVKFDPDKQVSEDMQKAGWQAILDNFKKYTEQGV